MSKTIDLQVEKVQSLTSGLNKCKAEAARCGVTSDEIVQLEQSVKLLKAAGEECDKLRAELSTKVKHMNNILTETRERFYETKKKIKISHPQEQWSSFGIADKR